MTVGWDVGGVNTKVARLNGERILDVRSRPYELQRAPEALAGVLRELATEVAAEPDDTHAVTMTAELSQMFRTKRDGVAFVLDAVERAFPRSDIRVFTTDGTFVMPAEARRQHLLVAASNWMATAMVVARHHPDALLIDIGTTSTDIVPIVSGRVAASGRTDPARLASGELVYTGAVRTPVEAIVSSVPYREGMAGVSAEGFALAGDVHVWRGDLAPDDYSVTAPDGRPATRVFSGERLARIVCADAELIDRDGIDAIADAVAQAQIVRVAEAIGRIAATHRLRRAVVTGVGAFIAERAARHAGLDVVALSSTLGDAGARSAPATAVALLSEAGRRTAGPALPIGVDRIPPKADPAATTPAVGPATVVKIGGALLGDPDQLGAAIAAVRAMAKSRRVLVVPGGGPFADAVRDVDGRHGLSDDAAHWMAILAMDQFAVMLAERLPGRVVHDLDEVRRTLAERVVPVLAPSRWLREADPLPHSWDVTSDSISAWVANQAGASELLLIKLQKAETAPGITDPHLPQVRGSLAIRVVSAATLLTTDLPRA